jgi:leucyl aminopeptidase
MKVVTTGAAVTELEAEAIVVGIYEEAPLSGAAAAVNEATGGLLSDLIAAEEVSAKKYEAATLFVPAGMLAKQVVVMGLGPEPDFDCGTAYRATAAAAKHLAGKERKLVAFYAGAGWSRPILRAAAAGSVVGCHGQDLYRSEKKRHPFETLAWGDAAAADVEIGKILGESVNLARRLVNQPANEIYPQSFAEVAEEIAQDSKLIIEVWDEDKLAAENCGALLAVARGSSRPPRLLIVRHKGATVDEPTIAFVGKGVTFDSGGLSLKSNDAMSTMKMDMSGAATVLATMQALARLDVPINVMGLVGLVENMPSGTSYKLGDVLKARNGKTIEVLNTDAEGRLVLADVLSVAVDEGASKIVDLATLTGACMVALGRDVAGVMTNDQTWCDTVLAAAKECGEPAWQQPQFPEYAEDIKSDVADIKNIGDGRWGGAITAAKFLEEFVGDTPWTHIDIAGPAFAEKTKPWIDGGGTGSFVRTLVEIARLEARG